eukprot:515195_1
MVGLKQEKTVPLILVMLLVISTYWQQVLIILFQSCWVIDQWTDHKLYFLQECINIDYDDYLERQLGNIANDSIVDHDMVIKQCPMIKAEDVILDSSMLDYNKPFVLKGLLSVMKNNLFTKYNNQTLWVNSFADCVGSIQYSMPFTCVNNISFGDYIDIEINNQLDGRFGLTKSHILQGIHDIKDDILENNVLLSLLSNDNVSDVTAPAIARKVGLNVAIGVPSENKNDTKHLHADIWDILNIQFIGEKKWTLFNPQYMFVFKPKSHKWKMRTQYGYNLISDSNMQPKYFDNIPRFECIVEAGDAIYIPTWFLHKVDYPYQHDSENLLSISMAIYKTNWKNFILNQWQSALALSKWQLFYDTFLLDVIID